MPAGARSARSRKVRRERRKSRSGRRECFHRHQDAVHVQFAGVLARCHHHPRGAFHADFIDACVVPDFDAVLPESLFQDGDDVDVVARDDVITFLDDGDG